MIPLTVSATLEHNYLDMVRRCDIDPGRHYQHAERLNPDTMDSYRHGRVVFWCDGRLP